MNTFNLAFVLQRTLGMPDKAVVTVVCASENPIDREYVYRVAMAYFQQEMQMCQKLDEVFRGVISGIRNTCGIQAVMVNADCATFISLQ